MTDVSLTAAVLAGLLSFLSPCVLPLVPPYLTFIAGTTVEVLASMLADHIPAVRALFFSTGYMANLGVLSALAGIAIIAMGLHFLGVWRFAFMYREKRVSVEKPVGLWGAYVMGLAFAFGWTPCIGPILAAILTVAGSEETVSRGAILLGAYSAGLGVPFLAAALAIEPFMGFLARFKKNFFIVEKVVGVLLVLTGIAFLTGAMQDVSFWLLDAFPGLAKFG